MRRFLTIFVVTAMAMVPVAVAQVGGSGTTSGDVGADSTVDGAGSAAGDATGSATGDVTGDATGDVTGDATGDVTGDATGDLTGDVDTGGDISSDVTLETETRAEAEAEAAIAAALDAQAKAQAESEAAASGLFGFFAVDGEAYTGSFVEAQLAADRAAVIDHSVGADGDAQASFFQELSLEGEVTDRLDGDAEAHVWTDSAQLSVNDDAAGTILVTAESQTSATIQLAADAQAQAAGKILWIESEGKQAAVAILGSGSFESQSDGSMKALIDAGSQLRFEAEDGSADWQTEQAAYADGRLGAEASIAATSQAAAQAAADAQASADATAQAAIAHAEEYTVDVELIAASASEVVVEVRSEEPQPRVVRFDIDKELAAAAASDLEMTMDGQAMTRMSSAADVYATADQAAYAVVEAEGHTEVVANVDGFSAHELRIAPASAEEPEQVDTPTAGIIVTGLALLGLAAIVRRH